MEVPGLAHNITSPLSPCEGMLKDLSLDAIQLCERDGKERSGVGFVKTQRRCITCRLFVMVLMHALPVARIVCSEWLRRSLI